MPRRGCTQLTADAKGRCTGLVVLTAVAESAVLLPAGVAAITRLDAAIQGGAVARLTTHGVGMEEGAMESGGLTIQPSHGAICMAVDGGFRTVALAITAHGIASTTVLLAGGAIFSAVALAITTLRRAGATVLGAEGAGFAGMTLAVATDRGAVAAVLGAVLARLGLLAEAIAAGIRADTAVGGARCATLGICAGTVAADCIAGTAVEGATGAVLGTLAESVAADGVAGAAIVGARNAGFAHGALPIATFFAAIRDGGKQAAAAGITAVLGARIGVVTNPRG